MRVGILGSLEVDGGPPPGGPKQRALLGMLVLARGAQVPDDRLAEAVWPERQPASAAHALQVYVSELRKGGLAVERAGSGYRLQIERLDADELEGLLGKARALRDTGQDDAALRSLDEALALWRGPPLAGLDGDIFAAEAGRLDELRVDALEERADCALALGRAVEVSELEALVAAHPLRERLRKPLMLALYRAGRQADALAAYDEARRALDELGLAPGADLKALQGAILRQEAGLDVEPEQLRLRRHLPEPATTLVGRGAEVDSVVALLRGDTRLVTLTGPGGAGKTRVALRAAHELAPAFVDGLWFVELAALVDPALVRPTIAQVLDLAERELERDLRDRELLLVLDNFEQLLEAGPFVGELLRAAPRLRVLTTSRSPLRVYGEHDVPILPLPPAEAIELFGARTEATGRGRLASPLVAEICDRLDNLPLAIELVAARAAELSPTELVDSLDRRLELASGGPRDLPERQRTLRAAIGWSHDLLEPSARRLLAALGTFAGGFTREAAEAVCGDDATALQELVDGSLVRRSEAGRYRMLLTIREYALERLEAAGDANELRRRHADAYLELAEGLAPAFGGEGAEAAYATLDLEHDNFRAALQLARELGSPELSYRLVCALGRFWLIRGHLSEGRAWLDHVLHDEAQEEQDAVPPLLRARALNAAASLDWRQGDLDLAGARATSALEVSTRLGDENEHFRNTILLGNVAQSRQDHAAARDWWEQSVELARRLENDSHLAVALNNLGTVVWDQARYPEAVPIFEECLAAATRAGSTEYTAFALLALGDLSIRLGDLSAGREQLTEALALFTRLGFHQLSASCCVWLAAAPEQEGDFVLAARLLGAAAGLRNPTGGSVDPPEQRFVDEMIPRLRAALGELLCDETIAAAEAEPGEVVREVLSAAPSRDG